MAKTYLVQTWSADGARVNHYESVVSTAAELKHLRTFLESKHAHVLITLAPKKKHR